MSAVAAPPANGPRKEAVLEGKYLRIVASAPDFANEGTDELNRKGASKDTGYGRTDFFVEFSALLAEERTAASYKDRMTESENGKPVQDAKWHAEFLLKKEGLELAKAVQIEAPKVPFPDATVVAYRAEGIAFDDPKMGKEVVYVVGVSFPGNKVAYAMSGRVITPVAAFDADPKKFDRGSKKSLIELFQHTVVERK
jgi:hypothetical protein